MGGHRGKISVVDMAFLVFSGFCIHHRPGKFFFEGRKVPQMIFFRWWSCTFFLLCFCALVTFPSFQNSGGISQALSITELLNPPSQEHVRATLRREQNSIQRTADIFRGAKTTCTQIIWSGYRGRRSRQMGPSPDLPTQGTPDIFFSHRELFGWTPSGFVKS